VFFLCGMTFTCLGWPVNETFRRFKLDLWLYRLGAAAGYFFSMDEAAGFHEYVGRVLERKTGALEGSAIQGHGYGWVVVYAIPCVGGVAFLVWRSLRILKEGAAKQAGRKLAASCLAALVGLAVALFALEGVQGYFEYHGNTTTIFPCFEEAVEVLILLCLIYGHLHIAETHEL